MNCLSPLDHHSSTPAEISPDDNASSIPMCGRIKESCWMITKISPSDNQREVLNMIQLLFILSNLIHQMIMWLTLMFMTIFIE